MDYKQLTIIMVFPLLLLSCGCESRANSPQTSALTPTDRQDTINGIETTDTSADNAPIAIVTLKDKRIEFDCVNQVSCPPDIELDHPFLSNASLNLGPVFYLNPSSIYLVLYSSGSVPMERTVIHYNPQTKQIGSSKLSNEIDNLRFLVTGESLVFAPDFGKTIYVMDDDLLIRTIEVGFPVNILVGSGNQKVIAVNEEPFLIGDAYFVNAAFVDVESGTIKKVDLKLPEMEIHTISTRPQVGKKYLIIIEGISRDLNELYCLFYLGSHPKTPRLGTFDFETSQEVFSTDDRGLVRLTSGYAQYHEFLYTINAGDGYGVGASLVDMNSVTSMLDFKLNPTWRSKLIIVPHGENLLLGDATRIFQISPTGDVIQTYPLPEEWVNQPYSLVYFMK